jgi:RND family efflux transporter MFP subunit
MKTHFLIIAAFMLASCKNSSKESAKDPVRESGSGLTHVKVEKVSTDANVPQIKALGIIMSESEAKPSFKTGGIIRQCYFREGSTVKKGQLLATLVMTEINAQVTQAEEAFAKAERDYRRVQNLYADSVATLEQLQNVKTAYEVSGKTLEIARFNQSQSEVRAPIHGRVVKQMLYEGEIAGPGMPVCYIMGTGSKDWKVVVGLNDRDWAKISKGDKAEVQFDAYPGRQYKAIVTEKAAYSAGNAGTLDVTLKLLEQPVVLAAGLVADVSFNMPAGQAARVIPIEALVKTNGKSSWVYTVENGVARAIPVRLGELRGNKVEIIQGLDGVDEVITIGSVYIEDGERVEVSRN